MLGDMPHERGKNDRIVTTSNVTYPLRLPKTLWRQQDMRCELSHEVPLKQAVPICTSTI